MQTEAHANSIALTKTHTHTHTHTLTTPSRTPPWLGAQRGWGQGCDYSLFRRDGIDNSPEPKSRPGCGTGNSRAFKCTRPACNFNHSFGLPVTTTWQRGAEREYAFGRGSWRGAQKHLRRAAPLPTTPPQPMRISTNTTPWNRSLLPPRREYLCSTESYL